MSLLQDCLGAETTPAAKWFTGLPSSEKTDFLDKVQSAFRARFPDPERAGEWERELAALRLEENKLGKIIETQGTEMFTHHQFANTMMNLAENANIATTDSLISIVRDNLPPEIKR
jgi:hypothetical protein